MTIIVNVDEAKAALSDLLAKIETGQEIVLVRGSDAIARLAPIPRSGDVPAAIAEIRASRRSSPPITTDEILHWRHDTFGRHAHMR